MRNLDEILGDLHEVRKEKKVQKAQRLDLRDRKSRTMEAASHRDLEHRVSEIDLQDTSMRISHLMHEAAKARRVEKKGW